MIIDKQQRLAGIARLYGNDALEIFQRSHICIVGIGGVGAWVAEALARTGINRITLVDNDVLCETNVNRQLHAVKETIGKSKTSVMSARIKSINPDCIVDEIKELVGYKNLNQCMSIEYDYVVDAIDNSAIKAAIVNWCKRNKVPVICIGGAGGQIEPSMIKVGDLNRTKNDPLLAKVRSQLRAYHGFSRNPKRHYSIECVYSTEQVRYPDGYGGTTFEKPGQGVTMDCNYGFGSVSHITGSFAFFAVARIIDKLIK